MLSSIFFKELIFSSGWYKVKFEIHNFLLGLLIDGKGGDLTEEGRFLYKQLSIGLLFEYKFTIIDKSLIGLILNQLKNFITEAQRILIERFISLEDVSYYLFSIFIFFSNHLEGILYLTI